MPTASTSKPIILWGATGQSLVLAEFLGALGWHLVALFDNNPALRSPLPGVPLFHGEAGFETWREFQAAAPAALVAIGGDHGRDRLERQRWLEERGCAIATVVHPTAYVAKDARLGPGTQVLAGAIVGAQAQLGPGVIVNTRASVDHECELQGGVHLGPGATLCGLVRVGAHTFIGAGAVVLPRLRVGADAVLGAGAVLTRDLPDNKIAYGNPARMIRARREFSTNESP